MLYLHLKQKLKNHCLCLKVANHYCFEAPEPAEGCTEIKSICSQFLIIKPNSLQSESGLEMFLWLLEK